MACAATLGVLGLRIYLPSHVPLGLVPALATAPVWLREVKRYIGTALLLGLVVASLVFGVGLAFYSSSHQVIDRVLFVSNVSLMLLVICGTGVVLWGRSTLGDQWTAVLFGLGLALGAALHGPSGTLNAWKGSWATPAMTLLLALTYRRTLATVLALVALAAASIAFDTRSQAVVLILCVLVVLWQRWRRPVTRQVSILQMSVVLLGLAAASYKIGTAALVRGYLGARAQQRSIEQIDTAGSLILGGRPEIAATLALMVRHPLGYGFGVLPSASDLLTGKEGLTRVNYEPNNGYVEKFMFGDGFELHSVVGDVWTQMGPVGLVLLVLTVGLLVHGLNERVNNGAATGLLAFLVLWTSWNLLFSPLLSSALTLVLGLGLVLKERRPPAVEEVGAQRRSADSAARE